MVKTNLLFVDETEELKNHGRIDTTKAKPFELSELEDVSGNVRRAGELWNTGDPRILTLQIAESKVYIVDSEDLQNVKENDLLFLKVSPVERCVTLPNAIINSSSSNICVEHGNQNVWKSLNNAN
jgi:hypothetical protein